MAPSAEHVVDRYAAEVADGVLPAGTYHRLACERHLRDRAREGTPGFPYRFDPRKAERFYRFASHLRHYKGEWAGELIRLSDCQKFRLGSIVGWVHVETNYRRFRKSYHELPRKQGKSLEAAIAATYLTFFDGEQGAEGYCLHPKTRILLADLAWKELDDIQVGDELVSVDEQITGFKKHRKIRHATVLGKVRTRRPALRITFTGGAEVVCSQDHKWLAQSTGGNGFKWREARELKPTYRISYIGEPWEAGRSWDAGYLSGLFDGEGYLHAPTAPNAAFRIGFSQRPGAVLDACGDALERCGFKFDDPRPHAGGTMELQLTGLYQCLRLLGSIKPRRLWARARDVWQGKKFPSSTATIERIERIGYNDLIDIETSTGTFIAEGLVSHNCAATKRDQSKIVFNDAKKLVESSGLKSRITVHVSNLHMDATASKLEPLSADHDSMDGLNVHFVDLDEYHALKHRGLVDVLETAMAARRQPHMFGITTAGDDPVSPCGDEHDYACKILDGIFEDETFFAFIAHADIARVERYRLPVSGRRLAQLCTCDRRDQFALTCDGAIEASSLDALAAAAEEHPTACGLRSVKWKIDGTDLVVDIPADDWLDERTWRKANPHYGISVKPEDMRALAMKAKNMPAAAAAFQQKRLNLWVNASAPWLSIDGWRAGQSTWDPDELLHESCWVGVDLASSIDLCAMVFVFPPTPTRTKTRLLRWVWTPQDTLKERGHRDRAPYQIWADQGHLILVDGVRINHKVIREVLVEQRERYHIEQIGFDPWHADQVMDDLTDRDSGGFSNEQVILVPQTYAGMSKAALDFEAAVLEANVDANGCPLMTWCASNAVVQRDGKDNIYPVKKKSRGRIDPIMATIIAWRLASLGVTTNRRGRRGQAKVWTPDGWKEMTDGGETHPAP